MAKIRVRYGDSKRTTSQKGKRFRGTHSYRPRPLQAARDGLRRGGQPQGQDREAAHLVRLRAGRRELDLAGPPLLMGVVNATPDSFSDAGELPDLEARAARAAAHVAAGAAIVDVGGESAHRACARPSPPRWRSSAWCR